MRLMLRIATLALSCPIAVARSAEAPSLCQQLAGHVWQGSSAGANVSPDQWIKTAATVDRGAFDKSASAASGVLAKALGPVLQPGTPGEVPEISRLSAVPLYMGSTLGGTANCEAAAFALVDTQGVAHRLPDPAGDTGPCWNVHGDLGTVFGAPAYVEHGTVDSASADTLTRITPWTHGGWGRACQLTVQFKYRYKLARRYCGDAAVCKATAAVAADVAQNYLVARQLPNPRMLPVGLDQPVPEFLYAVGRGTLLSPQAWTAVTNGWQLLARKARADASDISVLASALTSEFPTFGTHVPNEGWESSFSDVGFTLFPLMLGERLYLGAVAHNGVGWREGSNFLIAVYEPPTTDQAELVPLAGFVVERNPAGLRGTVVAEGGSAIPVPVAEQ
jgi:hypothetical protein